MSNHQIPVADLHSFIDNWRVTLPNREGDEHTATYILDNLEDFAKHYVPENESVESGDTIRNHVHIPSLGTGEPVTMSADQIRAAEASLVNARAEADTSKIIQAEQALSKARGEACDGE